LSGLRNNIDLLRFVPALSSSVEKQFGLAFKDGKSLTVISFLAGAVVADAKERVVAKVVAVPGDAFGPDRSPNCAMVA